VPTAHEDARPGARLRRLAVAARRDELGDVRPDGDVVETGATRELLQGHVFSYGDKVGKVADPDDTHMTKPMKLVIAEMEERQAREVLCVWPSSTRLQKRRN
jgi:hypothetical protein